MKVKCFLIAAMLVSSIITKLADMGSNTPKYPSILQISTRPYLYQLSKQTGQTIKTLRDIPESVYQEFIDKGFDYVWFMGVWAVGEYGPKHDRETQSLVDSFRQLLPDYTPDDAIGSPYAITDYYCNKELCPNGDSDLEWLKTKLNGMGIKLMLDFIPNHFALDSPLIEKNIDYFIRAPKGSQPPYDSQRYFKNGVAYGNMQYSSAWTDVAQLNYYNPDTRTLMLSRLKIAAKYADALRCDMAYIDTNDYFYGTWSNELNSWGWSRPQEEFWVYAIREVKQDYPNIKFMAEVYGNFFIDLINQGFDYTYDKELLDRYVNGNFDNIRGWINYMQGYQDHLCRFLENHDDNRIVNTFGGYVRRTLATAVATYTLPGMKFFFQDQWFGYKNKLEVHLRRAYAENKSDEALSFYNNFFTFINKSVFKNGSWTHLTATGSEAWRLLCWKLSDPYSDEKILVVVNYSDVTAGGTIILNDVSGSGSITIKELIGKVEYERNREELRNTGLNVVLENWSSQIFTYN